ncbi:hypothetical protein NEFER03_0711 [Nematocida sp. LUAm3]|nr:hypothetical protein NEFER03_0711 [Nematocida sp. LUAm3]KAI5175170.1 hypothetical protein NEFER02_1131 [Nematocida sp. LUAm2]KAI5178158.1 hypothetical protein NEFER01_1336 [Nematocida sp. LUAm1]
MTQYALRYAIRITLSVMFYVPVTHYALRNTHYVPVMFYVSGGVTYTLRYYVSGGVTTWLKVRKTEWVTYTVILLFMYRKKKNKKMVSLVEKKYVKSNELSCLEGKLEDKRCKRGIKAVQKAILSNTSGYVVLAEDITPFDLISHIPGLCAEKHIPLFYIRSRFDLLTQQNKPITTLFLPNDLLSHEEVHTLLE